MEIEKVIERYNYVQEQKDEISLANLASAFSDAERTDEEEACIKDIELILCVENLKMLSVLCNYDSEKYAEEVKKEFDYYKNRLQWLVCLPQKGYDRVFFSRIVFGIYYDNLRELIENDSSFLFKKVSDFQYIKSWIFTIIGRCLEKGYKVFAEELIESAINILPESRKMKTEDMKKLMDIKKLLKQ